MSSVQYQNNIPQLIRRVDANADKLVAETLFSIDGRMKAGMAEPKSGEDYGGHIASAPGEMPGIDTAAYVNALQVELNGKSGVIGTNQEQSLVLEFGGVHIAARPHFEPAFEDEAPEFEKRLREVFE